MASNLGRSAEDENDFDRQLMREKLRHERVSRAGDSRSRPSQERTPWYPRGQRSSMYSHDHPSSSRFISPSIGARFEGPHPKKFRPEWGGAPSYLAGGQPMSLRIPHFGPGQSPWQPQPDFHNHLYSQRSMPPPSPARVTSSLTSSKVSSTHNAGESLVSERGGGDEIMRKHAGEFFVQHKNEEWFRHKYHPLEFPHRVTERRKMVKDRRRVFERLARLNLFEKVNLEVNRVKDIVKILDAAVILMEGGSESDLKILDEEDTTETSWRESEKCTSSMPVKFTEPLRLDGAGDRSEVADVPKRVELESPERSSISESDEEKGADETPADVNASTRLPPSAVANENVKDGIDSSGNKIKEGDVVDEEMKRDRRGGGRPRLFHRTVSLFLKNLPTNTEKSDIEEICKCYPGFLRVALQDPQCENKFLRRAWVSFEPWVNIKDICWNMSSIKLKDCELNPTVNSELKQRVRMVNGVTCHNSVARQDVKHIVKVIQNLDSLHSVWDEDNDVGTRGSDSDCKKEIFGFVSKNPLLKNITDYLVEEGSYEEEALLDKTGSSWDDFDDRPKPAHAEVFIEKDAKLLRALDRMIIYLRIVHSLDYYAAVDYLDEGDMPHRCGIVHVRAAKPTHRVTQNDINEWMSSFDGRIVKFTEGKFHLTDEEMTRLGKDAKIEIEKFIVANTQEISKDKWLCPLSGKKFKGPDFVRKHIRTKHADKVDQVKVEVEFFNNYLRDTRRPQLPESQLLLLQNNPPNLPQNVPTSPSQMQQNTPIPRFIHHHYTQVRRPVHRAGNIVYRPPSFSEIRMPSDVYRPRERFHTGRGRFPRPPTSTNPDNQY